MKIIVDTNIVFSAIVNTSGTLGDLLLNSEKVFDFYAPGFLWHEIQKNRYKLKKISKLSDSELVESEYFVTKYIHFISEEQIPSRTWNRVQKLLQDIATKDTAFVALNNYLRGQLWTGDKKLLKGLRNKNYKRILTTSQMLDIRRRKENKEK